MELFHVAQRLEGLRPGATLDQFQPAGLGAERPGHEDLLPRNSRAGES
jgi:hypothetical protein